MAITNGYSTLAEIKSWLNITDSTDDTNLELCVETASRQIDRYTRQRFYLDSSATARTFTVTDPYGLDLMAGDEWSAIGSLTDLAIKTDSAGDGTYETTLAGTDYQLHPVDAPDIGYPWTRVAMVGTQLLPLPYPGSLTRGDRVEITARWGWPAVPTDIKLACLIQSARLFKRRGSPEGVAGFNDFGVVRLTAVDNDVTALLDPFRLVRVH